jgi:hypothetical protein
MKRSRYTDGQTAYAFKQAKSARRSRMRVTNSASAKRR